MSKSAAQMRDDIRIVRQFVDAAERLKVVIPMPLKVALAAYETATDVGVAFENVCKELERLDRDFEAHLARKYDPNDWQQQDQAYVERAAYNRRYQARAVSAVLSVDNDKSLASQLWREWKPKLKEVWSDHATSTLREFFESFFSRSR
jgi:isocitrate dehydrogenase kinase/phosphatase